MQPTSHTTLLLAVEARGLQDERHVQREVLIPRLMVLKASQVRGGPRNSRCLKWQHGIVEVSPLNECNIAVR